MASKHRDIGLKFRHRSTPNTRRASKHVGFGVRGGGVPYIYIYSNNKVSPYSKNPRHNPRTPEP